MVVGACAAGVVLTGVFAFRSGGGARPLPAADVASVAVAGRDLSSAGPPPGAAPTTIAAPVAAAAAAATTTSTTTDPGTLPQTPERPSADDPAFRARITLLWQAVVSGDSAAALPAFFPLGAYVQVKAIADPVADWHDRLVATYDRDLAGLHAALGSSPASATLLGVDVPEAGAAWIRPGVEYNKGSYWRVFGTRVRYSVDGRTASFVIQSLISWRGQWYVVHLVTPPR